MILSFNFQSENQVVINLKRKMDKDSNDKKPGPDIVQNLNIGHATQVNAGVEKVINYYGVDGKSATSAQQAEASEEKRPPMEQRDIPPIREQIMLFVSALGTESLVSPGWVDRHMDLWNKILDLPEVAAVVYNPGKQRGTCFNRNLVSNIIHYLGNQTNKEWLVYKDYNATRFTEKLGLDATHPVRGALGSLPPAAIRKSLDRFMENYLL